MEITFITRFGLNKVLLVGFFTTLLLASPIFHASSIDCIVSGPTLWFQRIRKLLLIFAIYDFFVEFVAPTTFILFLYVRVIRELNKIGKFSGILFMNPVIS